MQLLFTRCAVDDCSNNSHKSAHGSRGYCSMHYHRVRKYGDPSIKKSRPSPAKDWLIANKSHAGDECLPWPFYVGKDGYGRAHHFGTDKLTTAARLMCTLAHGEPPTPGHEAAHSCGNGHKACTNKNHLYWATHTINQADRVEHLTTNRGERQWKAKLTSGDVMRIRELLVSTSQAAIARQFHVDPSHISNIKRGKAWSWLTGLSQ